MPLATTLFAAAYAKVNLTLAVLGRREDGYHRLASVMQTISLHDTLRIEVHAGNADTADNTGDRFTCDVPALASPDNLVARAAELLRAEVGRPDLTAEIELHKEVPAQAGLGGGSSDAATALVALNTLWGLRLSMARLEDLAARLGSDTPYLVQGGTASIEGRGEIVEPLPDAEPLWLTLVKPPVDVSTRAVFGALTPADYGAAADTEAVIAAIRAGQPLPFDRMTNTLERGVARAYPDISYVRETLLDLGASHVIMSGSGSSLFSPFRSLAEAASLHEQARGRGMHAWLCHTVTRAQTLAARG
ncbi:MAG TPA: 4-(cytidine 5'-diphospho)-2-C-methyl-D-erythritol kinase [Ktedonobacterales bacterium]|jgi:4-diphosphocytidyl-2-C-methyl-D-erythritol kinase|nr:4-(cytidine 5'-diphospho)-2-C-methyl-D-erythritol kinase [Ktedonobacterales bacterium]